MLVLINKAQKHWTNFKIRRISDAEKINSKENYMISTRLNLKTRFVQKKKRHAIIN